MTLLLRRTLSVLVMAAAATLVVAPAAHADVPGRAYVSNRTLYVEAGRHTQNDVYMHASASDFAVHDVYNGLTLDTTRSGGCVQSTLQMIVCPLTVTDVNLQLFEGDDYVQNDTNRYTVVHGDAGADTVKGGSGTDVIYGSAGEDKLEGRDGNDTIDGGADVDEISGGYGDDTLEGGPGRETVYGDHGSDTLTSADQYDTLRGGIGNDTVQNSRRAYGDEGNDTVVVRQMGIGELWGGDGSDTVTYINWRITVHTSLDGNSNDGNEDADCDAIIFCPLVDTHNVHGDFEMVVGSDADDKITGNGENDYLVGGLGNDKLYGKGGDDILLAGFGTRQTTSGGSGDDGCWGYGDVNRDSCERGGVG